TSPFEFQF
ncbi:hypothetical protein D046_2090B, partial [Vibrio parahaemolyticus V-223/04]